MNLTKLWSAHWRRAMQWAQKINTLLTFPLETNMYKLYVHCINYEVTDDMEDTRKKTNRDNLVSTWSISTAKYLHLPLFNYGLQHLVGTMQVIFTSAIFQLCIVKLYWLWRHSTPHMHDSKRKNCTIIEEHQDTCTMYINKPLRNWTSTSTNLKCTRRIALIGGKKFNVYKYSGCAINHHM